MVIDLITPIWQQQTVYLVDSDVEKIYSVLKLGVGIVGKVLHFT